MTYKNFRDLLEKQKVYIEFVSMEDVFEDEIPDERMRGRLIGINPSEDADVEELRVTFDLSDFEEYNKSVAKHNWYDEDEKPSLTWFETKYYPEDGRVSFHIPGSLDAEATVFKLIEVGCEYCEGDKAILSDNGVKIFVDSTGRLDVFLDDNLVPTASTHIDRCPHCGRPFPEYKKTP